jgi:hypothetical protein
LFEFVFFHRGSLIVTCQGCRVVAPVQHKRTGLAKTSAEMNPQNFPSLRSNAMGVQSWRFLEQGLANTAFLLGPGTEDPMRHSLTLGRIILIGIVVAMAVSAAHADSILAVNGPATCPVLGCGIVNTFSNRVDFGFYLPAGGSGQFVITNQSIFTWKSLGLTGPTLMNVVGPIGCSSNLFANCSVTELRGGGTRIFLSGLGPGFTGILPGENFSFNFSCTAGPCTWKGNQMIWGFMVSTSATPEPGAMLLMLTGLAAIAKARRSRRA